MNIFENFEEKNCITSVSIFNRDLFNNDNRVFILSFFNRMNIIDSINLMEENRLIS